MANPNEAERWKGDEAPFLANQAGLMSEGTPMPKKQCNIRMSEATRKKLDDLTAIYGTQAEAVAVAIHNLWKEELDED